jgi:hypothetical protein
MKLEDYVYESWSLDRPGNPFPGHMEISHYLIQDFRELYKLTESRGQECGYILFYEGKSWPIRHDPVVYGDARSMNIPKSQSYYNFGNIHAHPSGSIGHSGGFSAHSMQDLLNFGNVTDRKLFMQFVVSGQKLYAMLFRAGWSRFNADVQKFANFKKCEMDDESRNYLAQKNFRNRAEFDDKMGSFTDYNAAVRWLDEMKLGTVGLGKKMEELSISACHDFARQFGYGFYIGKTEGFGAGKIHFAR